MKNVEKLRRRRVTPKTKIYKTEVSVPDKTSLENSLEELDFITTKMRKMALYIFSITLFNIFFPVLIFSGASYILTDYFVQEVSAKFQIINRINNSLIVFWIIFLFLTMIMIYFYESLRKKGEVLFEEVSDELEWDVKGNKIGEERNSRPEIDARVSLRSFAKTTDLPFIPGKYGPAFYLILNIVIPLLMGSRFLFRF